MKPLTFDCDNCPVRPDCVVTLFNEEGRRLLNQRKRVQQFPKRAMIFSEGQSLVNICLIRSGKVKSFKRGEEGKDLILQFCGAGDILGLDDLLLETEHNSSVQALTETVVCLIPKKLFRALLKNGQSPYSKLVNKLLLENRLSYDRLYEIAYMPVKKRLAKSLYNFTKSQSSFPERSKEVNWTREDLSGYLGSSRETVTRALIELREKGIIKLSRGKIAILDQVALEKMFK